MNTFIALCKAVSGMGDESDVTTPVIVKHKTKDAVHFMGDFNDAIKEVREENDEFEFTDIIANLKKKGYRFAFEPVAEVEY